MIKTLAKHVPSIRSCVIVGGVSTKVCLLHSLFSRQDEELNLFVPQET